MVAEGIVAGLAEEDVGRPAATGEALALVVAPRAVAPQLFCRAAAREAQRSRALPYLPQGMIADVPAHVLGGGQRRAALDVAVGLDAERRAPSPARSRVARAGATSGARSRTVRSSRCCFPPRRGLSPGLRAALMRASIGMTSSTWYGSSNRWSSSAARPIATVSCICQEWMPSTTSRSNTSGISLRLRRLICVLDATGIPAARRARIPRIAASKLPSRARRRSWVAWRPSIETLALWIPAAFASRAIASVMPRAPVVVEHCIPWARMARTSSSQSSRR